LVRATIEARVGTWEPVGFESAGSCVHHLIRPNRQTNLSREPLQLASQKICVLLVSRTSKPFCFQSLSNSESLIIMGRLAILGHGARGTPAQVRCLFPCHGKASVFSAERRPSHTVR
jgi:hypothetical protein